MASQQYNQTVLDRFYHWEKNMPQSIFLRQPFGKRWHEISYYEAGQEARKMVSYLKQLHIPKAAHIGIYSKNCYHWILADLAIMMGGYVSVPFYPNLSKDQLNDLVVRAKLSVLFVGKLDSWSLDNNILSKEVKLISFPHYKGNAKIHVESAWNNIMQSFDPYQKNHNARPEDLWTIKFTSGTTGTPKGVMHTYGSAARQMQDEEETNWIGVFSKGKLNSFSYLPLNHVGERIGIESPCIWSGGTISFAESLDTFAHNLQSVQPNIFFAVPRIWNKIYQTITGKLSEKHLSKILQIPLLGSALKKYLLKKLGFSRLHIAATGAAITPPHIKIFFKKLGIHLIEAYGMTELCGSVSYGVDPQTPYDSVGQINPKAEVKLDPKSNEILIKTPYAMKGYFNEATLTAEILQNGWLHTGDCGKIDDQGNLKILGRLGDTFKTSKGSFINPNLLEDVVLQNEFVEQVCVVGLGIPQPIALINLNELGLKQSKDLITQKLKETLHHLNQELANFEKTSTIVVVNELWSIENKLLTPTLKVRRKEIHKKWKSQFLKWHNQLDTILWI